MMLLELAQQLGQFEQQAGVQPRRWPSKFEQRVRISQVRPLTWNRQRAVITLPQRQRIHTGYASTLENLEGLGEQRMKRMTDRHLVCRSTCTWCSLNCPS